MNANVVVDAQILYQKGTFYKVIKLLKDLANVYDVDYKPKVHMMLRESYALTGQYYKTIEINNMLRKCDDYDIKNQADQYHYSYSQINLEIGRPRPNNLSLTQSVEDKNTHMYKESIEGKEFYDSNPSQNEVDNMINSLNSSNISNKESICFNIAEYFLLSGDSESAKEYYLKAAKYNPNKAINWGFAAQCHHRVSGDHHATLLLLENAIDLDPDNFLWWEYRILSFASLFRNNPNPSLAQCVKESARYAKNLLDYDDYDKRENIALTLQLVNQITNVLMDT